MVGGATALAAARRGARVAVLEARTFTGGHGSSSGTARIFAPFPFPDEEHLEMAIRALEQWREIERAAGEVLLTRTGALSRGELAERALPVLRDAGEAAELITAEAAARLGVRLPEDGGPVLHQPEAGTIHADRARGALWRLAVGAGATLHQGVRVRSIAESREAVEVGTDAGAWLCEVAIVAAGPWSRGLLNRSGIELEVTSTGQSVAHFAVRDRSIRPFAAIEYDGDEPYACWDPAHGLKAGLHVRGAPLDPDDPRPQVDPAAVERIATWVEARFPAASPRPAAVEACAYTSTPDDRFALQAQGRVVIAAACNGQGFQYAPETGARLAALATGDGALVGAGS